MTKQYIWENIRELLINGFSIEELGRFCNDNLAFRDIRHDLPENPSTQTLVNKLLEYSEQKILVEVLLAWAKENNPQRYEKHGSYYRFVQSKQSKEFQTRNSSKTYTPSSIWFYWEKLVTYFSNKSRKQKTRQNLLKKIRDYWITSILENSLHCKAMASFDVDSLEADIPLENIKIQANKDNDILLSGVVELIEIILFETNVLQISGPSGSGKTTTLLKLTNKVLELATKDDTQPIPIVLSLSTWKQGDSIENWLIGELNRFYLLEESISYYWLNNQEILLMLDDFNSQNGLWAEECTKAIKDFQQTFLLKIVLCVECIPEVKSGRKRCKSDNSPQIGIEVRLQMPESDKIASYLELKNGDLKKMYLDIQNNKSIKELINSPLNLSLIMLTYNNFKSSNIPNVLKQNILIEEYVQGVYTKPIEIVDEYSPEKTNSLLKWLAFNLKKQPGNPIFFESQIDETWFSIKSAKRLFHITLDLENGFFLGLLISIPLLLYFFPYTTDEIPLLLIILLGFALIIGPIVGVILGIIRRVLTTSLTNSIIDGIFGNLSEESKEYMKDILNAQINVVVRKFINILPKITEKLVTFIDYLDFVSDDLKISTLKWFLYYFENIPWNFKQILLYASKRNLLRKIGDRDEYMFVHRQLLDHFASTKERDFS